MTRRFMKRFAKVAKELGDDTESYAFGYDFPAIFAKLYPFDLDAEFYHPFIGMGVVDNFINEFFNKYVQKFPEKIQAIIDRYPRNFRGERFQLSNWIDDTTETETVDSTTDSTTMDGRYKFLGFKTVTVKRVSFTYTNANNNAPPVTVVCVYDHYEDGGKLHTIAFKVKDKQIMSFTVWAYANNPEVKAEKIRDFCYVKDLNNVLLGINCIWQDLDNPE